MTVATALRPAQGQRHGGARLVLGARLGVTEGTDPSTVPADHRQDYELFRFLSYLVQHLVVAAGGPAERELTWDVAKRMAREKRGEV